MALVIFISSAGLEEKKLLKLYELQIVLVKNGSDDTIYSFVSCIEDVNVRRDSAGKACTSYILLFKK